MNRIIAEFKKLDKTIFNLMKSGIQYNFGLLLISCFILLTYDFIYTSPLIYYIGISLFRASLFFIVGFIICSISFNKIKKDLKE